MRVSNIEIKDRVLLKKAIEKQCNDSLSKIYLKYESFIAKYIGRKVRLEAEIQDLTQTVFLSLCEGKCKYSGQSDAKGYLCGIAKNVLRDYFKAENRQVGAVSIDEIEVDGHLLVSHSHTEEPSEYLHKEEFRVILRKAIAKLPENASQAIDLVCLQGLKPIDACRKAGCSIDTFYNRLNHGRRLIKSDLSNYTKKT